MSAMVCKLPALMYQIDHVFLPPKLPQGDDFTVSNDRALITHVLHALRRFEKDAEGHHLSNVRRAIQMVSAMLQCRPGSSLDEQLVSSALHGLENGSKYHSLMARLITKSVPSPPDWKHNVDNSLQVSYAFS